MKTRPKDEPGQEWQLLPRGDVSHAKELAARAIVKTEAAVVKAIFEGTLG
jgi:hypothetical protein